MNLRKYGLQLLSTRNYKANSSNIETATWNHEKLQSATQYVIIKKVITED